MRLTQCDQTWPETLKNENDLKTRLDSIVGFSELLGGILAKHDRANQG